MGKSVMHTGWPVNIRMVLDHLGTKRLMNAGTVPAAIHGILLGKLFQPTRWTEYAMGQVTVVKLME